MDIQILTNFFKWCTLINGCIFFLWAVFLLLAPDFTYRVQNKVFPISRSIYDVVIYSFFGFFKVIYLVFNVVPYIALMIIGG